jgi:hypothetical protein
LHHQVFFRTAAISARHLRRSKLSVTTAVAQVKARITTQGGNLMQNPGMVRKFFAGIFGVIAGCLMIALLFTLFGSTDLDAGKLAAGAFISIVIHRKLLGEYI